MPWLVTSLGKYISNSRDLKYNLMKIRNVQPRHLPMFNKERYSTLTMSGRILQHPPAMLFWSTNIEFLSERSLSTRFFPGMGGSASVWSFSVYFGLPAKLKSTRPWPGFSEVKRSEEMKASGQKAATKLGFKLPTERSLKMAENLVK